MKIGILTHPLDSNYGCLLQAYALQLTLKRMGHEVVTIDRHNHHGDNFFANINNWIHRLAAKVIKRKNVSLEWNCYLSQEDQLFLSKETAKFVKRNITNTGRIFPEDLGRIDKQYKFDAYVVGSDQVWLPNFCPNSFLDFVKRENVNMLFYGASTGASCFHKFPKLSKQCKELAKRFSGISVREESLIEVSKQYLAKDAICVIDPTHLIDPQDYLDACVEKQEDTPVIFTYILDKTPEKQMLVERVQKDLNLPIVAGSVEKDYTKGCDLDIIDCIYPSVDNWILGLNRAKFVVTDSFHGTAMAILFGKPFVSIGNASRGLERFNGILGRYNLKERLVCSVSEFQDSFYEGLDICSVSDIREQAKHEAVNFLSKNLK